MSEANGSDARNEPEPVNEENENEDRREEPEGPFHELGANHRFQEVVQTFDEPFPEILEAGRNRLDPAGGEARAEQDACGDDPGHEH